MNICNIETTQKEHDMLCEIGDGDYKKGLRLLLTEHVKKMNALSSKVNSLNDVYDFIDDKLIESNKIQDKFPVTEIYPIYVNYCVDNLMTPIGRVKFYQCIRDKGFEVKRGPANVTTIFGCILNEPYDDTNEDEWDI